MAKKEKTMAVDKVNKRKSKLKKIKLSLCIILICLILLYVILSLIYEEGRFTVSLDRNLMFEKGIVLYESSKDKDGKDILYAEQVEFLDNISIKWLPENIHDESEGSHNGDNYIAYTFFIENRGKASLNYWEEILIDDVIKDVDKAVRVMVFRNDEKTVYAKLNSSTGKPEPDTKAFYSEDCVMLEERKDFKVGDVDKFTIVIWIEGDDPDCVNALLGGEIKMHMNIKEEHIE